MNLATLDKEYLIFGRVSIKYWSNPASLRYSISSNHGLCNKSSMFASIGVFDGRRFANGVLCNRFARYCCWYILIPSPTLLTWIPKKNDKSPSILIENSLPIHSML